MVKNRGLKPLFFCAPGGIRTPVARRRLIYSQMQLTTLPPTHVVTYLLPNEYTRFFNVFQLCLFVIKYKHVTAL